MHEAVVPIKPERARLDTEHPHRGFDNLWYLLSGSASTGHTTGRDGAIERARLRAGSLLKIRTGRGVNHAEGIGEDEIREGKYGEMRGVLFWVNLARKDKGVAPTAQVIAAERWDVQQPVPSDFNGFIYILEGEAGLGAGRRTARPPQIAVLGPGRTLTVVDARPGTRLLLIAGKPYGETPMYNGPYVD